MSSRRQALRDGQAFDRWTQGAGGQDPGAARAIVGRPQAVQGVHQASSCYGLGRGVHELELEADKVSLPIICAPFHLKTSVVVWSQETLHEGENALGIPLMDFSLISSPFVKRSPSVSS